MKITKMLIAFSLFFALSCSGNNAQEAQEHTHEGSEAAHSHDDGSHTHDNEVPASQEEISVAGDTTTVKAAEQHTHEDGSTHQNH